jgi:hypothetical protein
MAVLAVSQAWAGIQPKPFFGGGHRALPVADGTACQTRVVNHGKR